MEEGRQVWRGEVVNGYKYQEDDLKFDTVFDWEPVEASGGICKGDQRGVSCSSLCDKKQGCEQDWQWYGVYGRGGER